jgi:hypothetical protein
MKKVIAVVLCLVFVFCGACVRSLNPFYTDEAKIDYKEIKGYWLMQDDGSGNTGKDSKAWQFCEDQIRTCSDKGVPGVLKAVYFKIGDNIFMDTTAGDLAEGLVNEWWQMHTLPVHFVSKIEINSDIMVIKPLNNEWFVENLGSLGLSEAQIRTNQYDSLAIDIKPADWVQFLKKYANDEKAFSGKAKYTFQRLKAPEPEPKKANVK